MVFPLVILTVITCMLICMFFYTQTMEQSRLHIALRHACGEKCGYSSYHSPDPGWYGSLEVDKKGFSYISRGKENIQMKSRGLVSGRIDHNIESLWTTVDGVSYVRYCTLAGRVAETVKDDR